MYSVRPLKWSEVHNKWNDIKFPDLYQQYLQDTFGLTVINGRVLWGHVVEVTLVPVGPPPGAIDESTLGGVKKKKACKKIKLIFIIGDLRETQTKLKCKDTKSVKLINNIQNNIENQLS